MANVIKSGCANRSFGSLPNIFRRMKIGLLVCFFAGLGFLEQPVWGAVLRTQSLDLIEGWNAVYLDVDLSDRDPNVLFAGSPVDRVATFDGATFTRQFTLNPEANLLKELGWGVWYASSRTDSFLSDLGSIYGKKAYLVHSTRDFSLSISGKATYVPFQWSPNAYNLVGFTLDALSPPTFLQFFEGSAAHEGQAIYRLKNGIWKRVENVASEPMRSGEAFWIYCDGASDYQGPLRVEEISQGLVVGRSGGSLVLHNAGKYPIEPTVCYIASDTMTLQLMIHVVGDPTDPYKQVEIPMGEGSWETVLPALESGSGIRVPFSMDTVQPEPIEALLCIKTDRGTETWLPVYGLQEN